MIFAPKTNPTKTAETKLLGIWLPQEERWQMKVAAAARHMTLNQAVRQAMREWIARSQPASASTQAGAPQQSAKPGREPASAYAATLLRQAFTKPGKLYASRPRAASAPTPPPKAGEEGGLPSPLARTQASAPARKADAGQVATAPVRTGAPFAWLRGAAGLDWSACPAVESRAAPDGSRVWVFRGTHVTLKKVFRLLEEGHRPAKLGKRFNLDPQVFEEVLRFSAQRLAPDLPGAG